MYMNTTFGLVTELVLLVVVVVVVVQKMGMRLSRA